MEFAVVQLTFFFSRHLSYFPPFLAELEALGAAPHGRAQHRQQGGYRGLALGAGRKLFSARQDVKRFSYFSGSLQTLQDEKVDDES